MIKIINYKMAMLNTNPVFIKYYQLTNDPLWKHIFMNGYNNIFPHNYRYRNGVLSYNKQKIRLDDEPTLNSLNKLCNFFRCTSGIGNSPSTDSSSESIEYKPGRKMVRKRDIKIPTDDDIIYAEHKTWYCPCFSKLWAKYIKYINANNETRISLSTTSYSIST